MTDITADTKAEGAQAPDAAEGGGRGRRGRSGGAEARRAMRRGGGIQQLPAIERKIPIYEVLSAEGLEIIEHNADTVLEEIGIEFRDDEETLSIWKQAGADVNGTRVRFPRGFCRSIIQATAPRSFRQHARNPDRFAKRAG